jgi:hypothetical protein
VSALGNAEQRSLSFLGTPGAGDSEGGEIYPPAFTVNLGSPSERRVSGTRSGLQPKLQPTTRAAAGMAKNA